MTNPDRRLFPRLLAVLLPLAWACAGASTGSPLTGTPPERGARGPFAASIVSSPRTGLSADALRADFQRSLPTRSQADGWMGEYLVADEGQVGLITLWCRADQERAFHRPEWAASEQARTGAVPTVERLDVPVWIDNGNAAGDGRRVVVVVKLPLPWFHPRGIVESKILERVPEYQAIGTLDRKYFILTDAGQVGGIYLRHDRKSAESFYDAAWHAGVRQRYGVDVEPRTLEVLAMSVPAPRG